MIRVDFGIFWFRLSVPFAVALSMARAKPKGKVGALKISGLVVDFCESLFQAAKWKVKEAWSLGEHLAHFGAILPPVDFEDFYEYDSMT